MHSILILLALRLFLSIELPENYVVNPYVDIMHYEFNLAINDTTDIIDGSALVTAKIKGDPASIDLDLKGLDKNGTGMKIESVLINNRICDWTHSENKVRIFQPLQINIDSTLEIRVRYSGIPADGLIISKDKYGDRTFFSDNWPDRASNYLPVVDHPCDKATVDFIIKAPSHYKIVSNGYLVEESILDNGLSLTHWKETVPLPVKVMAFGAAPFAVQLAGIVDNIPVWTWIYYQNREEGFKDYSIAVKPLQFYITLLGPYPFEKLANVQSKTKFGGMENAGCIFYAESSVTGKGRAESLIAHEVAHQWFGNSVTEKDWHHIWLSEGFATYMTAVYMEKTYGADRLKEIMRSARETVLKASERDFTPVIDTTITDLMKLLSANSYQKGSWILHMLRYEMGDEKFWNGMRLYYSRFANGNALTCDFISVMEEAAGKDLTGFFYQWLSVPGQPVLRITSRTDKMGLFTSITIEQTQDYLFSFVLDIMVTDSKGKRIVSVPVSGKITTKEIETGRGLKLIPDPDVKLLFRLVNN